MTGENISNPIDGKKMPKRDEKKDIRNFGLFLTALFGVIGGISFWKQGNAWPYLWGVAGYAFITCLFIKPLLRPVFKAAMWLGMKINWVMTRIILTVFFFIVLAPTGILTRLLGKDLLKRKFDPNAESYWQQPKRPEYKPEYSERLY